MPHSKNVQGRVASHEVKATFYFVIEKSSVEVEKNKCFSLVEYR